MALPPYILGPNPWASLIQQQQQVQVQVAQAQAAHAQAQAAAHAQAVAAVQAQLQAQAVQASASVPPPKVQEPFSEEKLQEKGECLKMKVTFVNVQGYLHPM